MEFDRPYDPGPIQGVTPASIRRDREREAEARDLDAMCDYTIRRYGFSGRAWDICDRLSNAIRIDKLRAEYFLDTGSADEPPMPWIAKHNPQAARALIVKSIVVERVIALERAERNRLKRGKFLP